MSSKNRRAEALKRLSARHGSHEDDTKLAGTALAEVYKKVRERGELAEGEAFAEVEAETERMRRERRLGVHIG